MDRAHRNKKGNGLRIYGPGYRVGLKKKMRKVSIRCKLQSLLAVSVTVGEIKFKNLGMQSE